MASENVMYSNGNTNGTTARHGHGLSDVEKGNQGIGAAMSPQEEDRFERFAAAMAANNKLRDAQRVNSLRCDTLVSIARWAVSAAPWCLVPTRS